MRSSGGARAIAAAVVAGAMLPAMVPAASALARISPAVSARGVTASRLPPAGNAKGHAFVPKAARRVNTSSPDHVIGSGTATSCTSAAVVQAVAQGGIITFSCGPNPVTIRMRATAKVVNTSRRVVLDGGGKVVLSGAGKRRILYMNTCDKRQKWVTGDCTNQATPQLVVQNLTFRDGHTQGRGPRDMAGGSGGAIFDEGGQLKVVNSRFINNRCFSRGPDLGGAAVRAFEMYRRAPVYIVHSTFSGGACSNGAALSSIAASWTVLNSLFENNRATGWGANPASRGTPGGGSGGAIYTDGDAYSVFVAGTIIRSNHARAGGGAIFYVCDARCGNAYLRIRGSTLHDNPSAGFHNFPGTIFYHGAAGHLITVNSHLD